MKKYDNRKTILISIMFVVLVVLGVVGFTYAFFSANVIGNDNATETIIETADLKLVFNDTQVISLDNALPGASQSKVFTIQNIGNVNLGYDIVISDLINTFVNDELLYTIVGDNGGGSIIDEPIPTEGNLLFSSSIDPGVTQVFTITVKFKETGKNQNTNMGAEFSGKLQINANYEYLTIGGYVYDNAGNIMPGVKVEIHSDLIRTTTNQEGYYELKNVTVGNHTLYIKEGETILGTKEINIQKGTEPSIEEGVLKVPSGYKNVNIKVEEELDISFTLPSGG